MLAILRGRIGPSLIILLVAFGLTGVASPRAQEDAKPAESGSSAVAELPGLKGLTEVELRQRLTDVARRKDGSRSAIQGLQDLARALKDTSQSLLAVSPGVVAGLVGDLEEIRDQIAEDKFLLDGIAPRMFDIAAEWGRPIRDIFFDEFMPVQRRIDPQRQRQAFDILQRIEREWRRIGRAVEEESVPAELSTRTADVTEAIRLTDKFIDQSISSKSFSKYRDDLVALIGREIKRSEDASADLQKTLAALEQQEKQIVAQIGALQQEKERTTAAQISAAPQLTTIFAAASILALFLVLAPWVYKDKGLQGRIFQSGIILDIITVLILVLAVTMLALARILESDAVSALLGGIAGYTLGRSVRRPAPSDRAEDRP